MGCPLELGTQTSNNQAVALATLTYLTVPGQSQLTAVMGMFMSITVMSSTPKPTPPPPTPSCLRLHPHLLPPTQHHPPWLPLPLCYPQEQKHNPSRLHPHTPLAKSIQS